MPSEATMAYHWSLGCMRYLWYSGTLEIPAQAVSPKARDIVRPGKLEPHTLSQGLGL